MTYEIIDNGVDSTRPYQFKVGSYLSRRFVHRKSAEEMAEVYCRWMFGTGRIGQFQPQEFDPTTAESIVKPKARGKKVKAKVEPES